MGPLWHDNGLVFPNETGGYLEESRAHRVFERVCERAGVPATRVFDLRHTSASPRLAAGLHPKVVAERLGHANVTLPAPIRACCQGCKRTHRRRWKDC